MITVRTKQEIERVMAQAQEQTDAGTTKWRNMTYEEGVEATLRWILDDQDETPMED